MKKINLSPTSFQKRILRWFDQHGRKQLPWQVDKTPYRVWVSEIMLQQTQVQTVIPYFKRFMDRFPDVFRLAQASEDEVLALWAGLGYYSRARNLHKASQLITQSPTFPHRYEDLCRLPGVGPSTAGAILALAFKQRATILDGNVKRIMVRFHGIHQPIDDPNVEKKLWLLADQLTPLARVADYTQAIMDLGALVCTRAKPACPKCPLQSSCVAYRANNVEKLPMKGKKRQLPVRSATFLVLKNNRCIYLHKRPTEGIWGGLWCLPELANEPCPKTIQAFCEQHFAVKTGKMSPLTPFRHTFTHYHLDIHPMVIKMNHIVYPRVENKGIWYDLTSDLSKGVPKPIRMIIGQL